MTERDLNIKLEVTKLKTKPIITNRIQGEQIISVQKHIEIQYMRKTEFVPLTICSLENIGVLQEICNWMSAAQK